MIITEAMSYLMHLYGFKINTQHLLRDYHNDQITCMALHVFPATGYFKCRSGKIISETLRCNRHYDCTPEDFSDEQNCRKLFYRKGFLLLLSLLSYFNTKSVLF